MSPFVARLDRFVRWFFNSSPTAVIEARAPIRKAASTESAKRGGMLTTSQSR